jgi:hypothetical protein
VQHRADEGIGGECTNGGVDVGGDSTRAETSARGASTIEIAGDDTRRRQMYLRRLSRLMRPLLRRCECLRAGSF